MTSKLLLLFKDCWMAHNRTAWGELQPNPTAFPNGMKAVADYVSIQMRFIIKSVSNNNGNGND